MLISKDLKNKCNFTLSEASLLLDKEGDFVKKRINELIKEGEVDISRCARFVQVGSDNNFIATPYYYIALWQ